MMKKIEIKDIVKSFIPSIMITILHWSLSLLSTCIGGTYPDPLKVCRNGYLDIAVYHWFINFVVLPAVTYFALVKSDWGKSPVTAVFVRVILLIIWLLLVIQLGLFTAFLDLPFSSRFV